VICGDSPRDLTRQPVHLGRGGSARVQPVFTGMEWYDAYSKRTEADGTEGRLVSLYDMTDSWTSWEMHPAGDEVVVCVSGRIVLVQEAADGNIARVTLAPGGYVINPPGIWHTADIAEPCRVLFITAGQGTRHRPRD
jgi:uncharacterized cupin superfamily protein